MAVQPYYSEQFTPAGAGVNSQTVSRAREDAQASNEDAQARMFQEHLSKGLQGMQEVVAQLPPEVQAQVGDPTAMSASDDQRVLWYQTVNQAINKHNMAGAAAQGDQAGVDRMSLNDPKATQGQFDQVTANSQVRSFMQDFKPTTQGAMPGMGGGYAPAGNTADLGNEDEIYVNTAKETEKNLQDRMPWIEKYSTEHGVPKALALALAGTESRGVQDSTSPTGVRGAYQLTESTAKEMGVNREDPEGNIKGGIGYLKKKLDAHDGDVMRALAAYNGGDEAVKQSFKKYGDKWRDHLAEFLKPIKTADGKVISPSMKAQEMVEHGNRAMKYNAYFGGSEGLAKTDGATETKEVSKTSQQVATEALKAGMSPETAKKLTDLLGSSGGNDLKAFELMLRAKHGEERQNRFETSEDRKGSEFVVRRADAYQKKNEETIDAAVALKDVHEALEATGLKGGIYGDPDSVDIPGVGVGASIWRGVLQSQKGVDVRVASANLDMIIRHKYFGATLTDNEQKAFKEAAGKGIPDNQRAFISALRKINKRMKATLRPTGNDLRKYLRDGGVITWEDLPGNDEMDGALDEYGDKEAFQDTPKGATPATAGAPKKRSAAEIRAELEALRKGK